MASSAGAREVRNLPSTNDVPLGPSRLGTLGQPREIEPALPGRSLRERHLVNPRTKPLELPVKHSTSAWIVDIEPCGLVRGQSQGRRCMPEARRERERVVPWNLYPR